MATTTPNRVKGTAWDRLRRAFASKDEAGFEEVLNETQGAVEASQEEAEAAALAAAIAEAVQTAVAPAVESAMAPLVARLDGVEEFTNDLRKTRDALKKARKTKDDGEDKTDYTNYKGGGTYDPDTNYANDNAALVAFLKAKGLSDEDIAEAVATLATQTSDDSPDDTAISGGGDVGGVRAQSVQENAAGGGQSVSAPGGEPTMVGGTDDDAPSGMGTQEMSGPADGEMTGAGAGGGSSASGNGTDPGNYMMSTPSSSYSNDSSAYAVAFRDTVARAEILAPGIKLPTFDAKAKAKTTADALCALRRATLKRALDSADRKAIVAPFVTDAAALGKMSCDVVRMAFIGASEAAKTANKPAARTTYAAASRDSATRDTIADINKRNRAFWGQPAR